MGKKVLLTGISGFLGSQIADELLLNGYEVLGLKRANSNLWRCKDFLQKITWVNLDDKDWNRQVINLKPEIFVHAAWSGVGVADRDNWQEQLKNINLTLSFLELAKTVGAEKFIGFGSQAEYGSFSGAIDENYPLNPVSAYGLSKNLVSQTIKCFSEQNNIDWCWLRLFSFFGEKEDSNWFIPMTIKNIEGNKPMDMTPGLQKYAYMNVKDLAKIIVRIVASSIKSDVYNLSSAKAIELKKIVEKIIDIINPENPQINFGAIPYRENQPMIVMGDTEKLRIQLGDLLETDFDSNLRDVVKYILKR